MKNRDLRGFVTLKPYAVKPLSIGTGWSYQTLQTKVRLHIDEQSDQDLHSLSFHLYLLGTLAHCKTKQIYLQT